MKPKLKYLGEIVVADEDSGRRFFHPHGVAGPWNFPENPIIERADLPGTWECETCGKRFQNLGRKPK